MKEHLPILRRVGIVLIIVGLVDIAWMVWCITHDRSYSSSFNIFAVIAGILLLRGGLKTAKYTRYFALFIFAALIGLDLVMPFMFPFGYWLAVFHQAPGTFFLDMMFSIIVTVFVFWVQRSLGQASITEAQIAAGISPATVKKPILIGALLPIVLCGSLILSFRGETAAKVIAHAKAEHGESYHYVIKNLRWSSNASGTRVSAIVEGYNSTELKMFRIGWDE